MGRSLDAFIAYGSFINEPEFTWTDEEACEGYGWPWDEPGHWWTEHTDMWLAHLYGYVPEGEDYDYGVILDMEEKNPLSIEYVSWGDDDDPCVILIKESKLYTGDGYGFMPFDPSKLLDVRDTNNKNREWINLLGEFAKKSGLKLEVSWFVGYSFG